MQATVDPLVPKAFVVKRAPQTDDELWWAVYATFGIKIPRQSVCADHDAPFTAFADAFFARSPVAVWKASRGFGGKSFMLGLLSICEAVWLGAQSSVLGGSGAQSLNVHRHSQEMWAADNAPRYLIKGELTKLLTELTNGGGIQCLMASQSQVRGPHPQRLRLDEIDEMDMEIRTAAQGQPMRKKDKRFGKLIETQTVMSSTHQYPDGTMTQTLAEAKEKGWPCYHWCYRETSNPIDGWLDPSEVARKKEEIPSNMWDAEYELQEPSFEGRAINADAVVAAFNPLLGEFTGEDPVVIEEREDSAGYVTAVDWAKQQHLTVIATYRLIKGEDGKPRYRCVAWQKTNRLQWQVMVGKAIDQWRAYGGPMVHDKTGLGDVVDDIISETVTFEERARVKGMIMPQGRERHSMFTEYIAAIEHGYIEYPHIEIPYDEHRYVRDEDLFGRGHPPDSVITGAVAWFVRPKSLGKPVTPLSITKSQSWNTL